MIQVIEKAFNILELLSSDTSKEFSLSEIAEALAMDKGTCSNIMKTLKLRGYVDQSVPRKGYKLGYMIYRLSDPFVNNDDLTRKSIDEIDLLGARFNEAVLLSVLRQDKRVVLYGTMPDQELSVRTSREVSVYRSNTGRLILSYYSDEELIRFKIIPLLDTVMMDIKHIDPEVHKTWTGISNEKILENALYIATIANELIIRVPVIPGFNADDETIRGIAKFCTYLEG